MLMNLRGLGLLLPSLLSESFIVVVVTFLDFFISLTTIGIFIKTAVVNYWKRLNLLINNKSWWILKIWAHCCCQSEFRCLLCCMLCPNSSCVFALCLVRCVSCLVSHLCLISCTLRLSTRLLPLPYVLYVVLLALYLPLALCRVHCVSCLVSWFCLVSYTLSLSSYLSLIGIPFSFEYSRSARFFSLLLCVLWVTSLALSLAFALCLVYCVSCLVSRSSSFCSYLSVVDLLVFSLYIVSRNKQLYVELTTNQYRYLVWCCWLSCALFFCLLFCALRLLPCFSSRLLPCFSPRLLPRFSPRLLPRLLPCFLSGFRSCLDIIDLLIFYF